MSNSSVRAYADVVSLNKQLEGRLGEWLDNEQMGEVRNWAFEFAITECKIRKITGWKKTALCAVRRYQTLCEVYNAVIRLLEQTDYKSGGLEITLPDYINFKRMISEGIMPKP